MSPQPPPTGPVFDLTVNVIREPGCAPMSPRIRDVCWDFGIPPREAPAVLVEDLRLELSPGMIAAIVGPSGSGKSSLLGEVASRIGPVVRVGAGRFPDRCAVVDAVAPREPLAVALEVLTACGLGEPRLWVRRFSDLSDGERFRAQLARAVGHCVDRPQRPAVVCDEFTAILHRRLARAVSYNLRKLVTRHRLLLLVATTHEDVLEDLQPDLTIRLGEGEPRVERAVPRDRPMSLRRRAAIEPGSVRDYAYFSPMHYRHRDGLGFVDCVFLLKDRPGGAPLGILVFAHAPMELNQRNRATDARFSHNVRRLNRELRILRRLVMHPDIRGCGLGHWFVRRTLPRVGVRFVECLAAMGAVNPVFEKAGLTRVGRCPLPRGRLALLARLRQWRVDPFAPDFAARVARCPRVRRLVESTVQTWIDATHGASRYSVAGRPAAELARSFRQLIGQPPIYYLWDRDGEFPRPDDPAAEPPFADPNERPGTPGADRRRRSRRCKDDRHHPDARPEPGAPRRRRSRTDDGARDD